MSFVEWAVVWVPPDVSIVAQFWRICTGAIDIESRDERLTTSFWLSK